MTGCLFCNKTTKSQASCQWCDSTFCQANCSSDLWTEHKARCFLSFRKRMPQSSGINKAATAPRVTPPPSWKAEIPELFPSKAQPPKEKPMPEQMPETKTERDEASKYQKDMVKYMWETSLEIRSMADDLVKAGVEQIQQDEDFTSMEKAELISVIKGIEKLYMGPYIEPQTLNKHATDLLQKYDNTITSYSERTNTVPKDNFELQYQQFKFVFVQSVRAEIEQDILDDIRWKNEEYTWVPIASFEDECMVEGISHPYIGVKGESSNTPRSTPNYEIALESFKTFNNYIRSESIDPRKVLQHWEKVENDVLPFAESFLSPLSPKDKGPKYKFSKRFEKVKSKMTKEKSAGNSQFRDTTFLLTFRSDVSECFKLFENLGTELANKGVTTVAVLEGESKGTKTLVEKQKRGWFDWLKYSWDVDGYVKDSFTTLNIGEIGEWNPDYELKKIEEKQKETKKGGEEDEDLAFYRSLLQDVRDEMSEKEAKEAAQRKIREEAHERAIRQQKLEERFKEAEKQDPNEIPEEDIKNFRFLIDMIPDIETADTFTRLVDEYRLWLDPVFKRDLSKISSEHYCALRNNLYLKYKEEIKLPIERWDQGKLAEFKNDLELAMREYRMLIAKVSQNLIKRRMLMYFYMILQGVQAGFITYADLVLFPGTIFRLVPQWLGGGDDWSRRIEIDRTNANTREVAMNNAAAAKIYEEQIRETEIEIANRSEELFLARFPPLEYQEQGPEIGREPTGKTSEQFAIENQTYQSGYDIPKLPENTTVEKFVRSAFDTKSGTTNTYYSKIFTYFTSKTAIVSQPICLPTNITNTEPLPMTQTTIFKNTVTTSIVETFPSRQAREFLTNGLKWAKDFAPKVSEFQRPRFDRAISTLNESLKEKPMSAAAYKLGKNEINRLIESEKIIQDAISKHTGSSLRNFPVLFSDLVPRNVTSISEDAFPFQSFPRRDPQQPPSNFPTIPGRINEAIDIKNDELVQNLSANILKYQQEIQKLTAYPIQKDLVMKNSTSILNPVLGGTLGGVTASIFPNNVFNLTGSGYDIAASGQWDAWGVIQAAIGTVILAVIIWEGISHGGKRVKAAVMRIVSYFNSRYGRSQPRLETEELRRDLKEKRFMQLMKTYKNEHRYSMKHMLDLVFESLETDAPKFLAEQMEPKSRGFMSKVNLGMICSIAASAIYYSSDVTSLLSWVGTGVVTGVAGLGFGTAASAAMYAYTAWNSSPISLAGFYDFAIHAMHANRISNLRKIVNGEDISKETTTKKEDEEEKKVVEQALVIERRKIKSSYGLRVAGIVGRHAQHTFYVICWMIAVYTILINLGFQFRRFQPIEGKFVSQQKKANEKK